MLKKGYLKALGNPDVKLHQRGDLVTVACQAMARARETGVGVGEQTPDSHYENT